MVNITLPDTSKKTIYGQLPSRPAFQVLKYNGNFGATEGETPFDIVAVDPYRSVTMTVVASAWGTGTVIIRLYPCDSQGNTVGSQAPFFAITLTANSTTVVILSEMGGAVTAATYPPSSPATSGSFIGPFGNFLKLTENCTAFTSGTNTVAVELDMKG
jgi:hypothetical protein